MLQISGTGASLRGFGDARTDVITLQLAANRYAKLVGKAALVTDGAIGPLTLAMVQAALRYLISQNVNGATGLMLKLTSTTALANNAVAVSTFLNDSMDAIRVASMPPTTSPASTSSAFSPTPSAVASQLQKLVVASSFSRTPGAQPTSSTTPPTQQYGLTPGLTPSAYAAAAPSSMLKYAMIGGGVLVGLYLLKKMI